ncbi:MAG: PD-(D/E)XK nuclease family protein [Alistipes sp.]|nr:PD-(D/E)XK nuclease family protein [Alistipes sp.]
MTTFQSELAQALLRRHSNDLSELVVLFPSLRARAFFNDALNTLVDSPIWQPSWSTIDEIMERGSGLVRGERIRLISELFKIYSKHHPSESFDRFYFWGDMLISDFDMIDKYLVDADKLLRNIEDIKEIEADVTYLTKEQERILSFWSSIGPEMSLTDQKRHFLKVWRSLPAIYKEYRERLFRLGIGYPGMIYRATAERIKRGESIELLPKCYVLAGFNALSKSEEILFNHLAHSEYGAEFYWDYDDYYVANRDHEAGLFMRGNLSNYPATEPISHNNFTNIKKQMCVTACASNIVQVKHISNIINAIPKEELDKRTAIVLTDENLLIPLLHSFPESVDSVNVTMGYPIKTTLAYTFVERLFALQAHSRANDNTTKFYYADVMELLSHPYIVDSRRELCLKLSNDITANRITSVDYTMFTNDSLLSTIFSCKCDCWKSLSQYICKILSALLDAQQEMSAEHIEYLNIVHEEIRKTSLSLENCDIETSIEIYTSLLRRHLQSVTIPFEGEPIEGLQIMGILETRNIEFKNVIILSMTDANFPGNRTEQPSFIPYSLRLAYGMPTPEEHEAMYAYYFYRLIQRAERVDMLYCSRADEKSTGEQSRYIYQLEYESPYRIEKQSVGVDLKLEDVKPIAVAKGEKEMAILNRYLTPDSGYALSPTALFRYIECPLKFYFATIAHIKTPDEISSKIDALTFGNILHETMQALYTPLVETKDKRDAKDTKNKIAELCNKSTVEQAVDKTIARLLQGDESATIEAFSGDTLLVRDIIIKYIYDGIMRYDSSREEFTIAGLEDLVELSFPISNGRLVNLSGRADRIDRLKDGTLQIIDYKSGNKPHLEFNGISTLFNGAPHERISNIFQTLLYSMMLQRKCKHKVESCPSLFYASQMLSDEYSPFIVDKGGNGKIEKYSDVSQIFEQELTRVFEELFNPNIPFEQVEDTDACTYCDYKKICGR